MAEDELLSTPTEPPIVGRRKDTAESNAATVDHPVNVDHPARKSEEITPDPVLKVRKPLNPAYAILAGAVLTAASGITATFLTIRSSERLTRERDRTDLARQERDQLQKQLEKVQADLVNQSAQLQQFSSTSLAVPVVTQLNVPPSIVVVLPPGLTVGPVPTVSASTTKATLHPQPGEPVTVPQVTVAVTAPVSSPASSAVTSTSTVAVPTIAPASTVFAPNAAASVIGSSPTVSPPPSKP